MNQHRHPHSSLPSPRFAIIDSNVLAAMGLASIIRRIVPSVDLCLCGSVEQLCDNDDYTHYFVSAQVLLSNVSYFLQRQGRTIVLTTHAEAKMLPTGFHLLNVNQSEVELVRAILSLAERGHASRKVSSSGNSCNGQHEQLLTPREIEVTGWMVRGLTNKEIAEQMGVGVATIITHRKNISRKLRTRSISAITIYAVMHGIVPLEEI